MTACDHCLRRTDLIASLAGHLQIEFKRRSAPARVLALHDEDLLELADQATVRRRYATFDASAARARATEAALTTICGCRDGYPERLRDLADPPAVLHVRGDPSVLSVEEAVAVVGARKASSYGIEIAPGQEDALILAVAVCIDQMSHD